MKHYFLFILSFIVISGCSSQADYRQAKNDGYGYNETKISETQYRVHFKAKGSDKQKALDFAMLRAAEVTLLNGFDWFIVTDRETLVDRERSEPATNVSLTKRYNRVTNCGLLTCQTTHYPDNQLRAGVFIGGSERSEIESILYIETGKGTRPSLKESFDAREVRESLKPKEE